jgi:hypothetical protein
LEELKEEPFDQRLIRYKANWLCYVTRINKKMPKIMLKFIANRLGLVGRSLKRILDKAKIDLSRPN